MMDAGLGKKDGKKKIIEKRAARKERFREGGG
jgi:hypothetical protein